MKDLSIEATMKTPSVELYPERGSLIVRGRSIPENSDEFYGVVLEALQKYLASPRKTTTVEMYLDYFNTSSSKYILKIFRMVESAHLSGKTKVSVKWLYEDGDEDLQEAGEDFAEILAMPFEISVDAQHET